MVRAVRTTIVPPRLASLPRERAQLEYSSRSIVFVEDGRRLLRAWGSPERPWILGIEPEGRRWRIEAWGAGPSSARAATRALFSLDHPLEEFYRLTRGEPALSGTERSFRGLRIPRDANLYEALLHAIVGQQLSVAAANAIKARLFERLDGWLEADGIRVPWVPPPSRLLSLGASGLRTLGLSEAKSRALIALAGWASHRPPSVRALAVRPLDTARTALEALPGVGRWTAENALLRGVGRPDVFVAGDLGLRVALDRFGVLPRSAPEEAAREWADRNYPGWGSYATLYLWRKLVEARGAGSAE
jgi:3-methyladenine DNA glycosylase/8-oxoguanine DNA glycosylase